LKWLQEEGRREKEKKDIPNVSAKKQGEGEKRRQEGGGKFV